MKRLLIWGTGSQAENILKDFPHQNHKIIAFVDSNPDRHGQFHDLPCIGPQALANMDPRTDYDEVVIASAFHIEIMRHAIYLGIPKERLTYASYLHFVKYTEKMTPTQLDILSKVPWWYHSFEILPGVPTPGHCHFKPWLLAHPELSDLSGQRALDIGAWDGPYTLEMIRRGAEVTAFDIQPATCSGFDAMRKVNGLATRHVCANVYNLDPTEHGTYDLVTFFGVYYHLKNPLAAFENINGVLRDGGLVLIEGAILEGAPLVDKFWRDKAGLITTLTNIPVGYYVKDEFESEWSNWWVPNLTCLRHWVESCGFEVLENTLVEGGMRGYCIARKCCDISPEHMVLQSVNR